MVDTLANDVGGELTAKNSQTHGRIFEKIEGHGEELQDHEKRITVLETQK